MTETYKNQFAVADMRKYDNELAYDFGVGQLIWYWKPLHARFDSEIISLSADRYKPTHDDLYLVAML